ncbi:MAG TPA: hypothetical protein VGX68_13545 [Thermoanaerobaculia bacterium]|jgi:hypothetical protein|nr:hypothetical protein [Thermoanaerobaculia bacterium]
MQQEAIAHDPMRAAAARPDASVRAPGRLRASLLIGLCCLLVYNANRRAISAGDTYPARYLPFAIVQYHTLFLDPVASVTAQGRGNTAFWMVSRPDGHIISLYPVVVPVLVAPLYVPAVAYLRLSGWTDARLDRVAKIMEKLSASLLAALSASLLYLLLRRRARASIALLLTVAYAFGTTTWVIGSQALWQHGMGALLVIAVLLLLTGPSTAPRALAAGLLCGLLAANRPPDAVLAATLGVYALFWAGRRRAAWLAAAVALPATALLLYNFGAAGNFLGGYGLIGKARFFNHDLLVGVAGLLFSPARGLFVFSPFLLFLALAPRSMPRSREERLLMAAMIAAVAIQILLYAKADWRGGLSWGPRYLTDLLPFLIWMLVPVVSALRGVARIGFLAAVGAAIVIEAIGAFWYSPAVDIPIFAADRGAEYHDMRAVWKWRNAPFLTSLRQGPAPAELAAEIRGTLDRIEAGGRATSVVTAGEEVAALGWALAGHATPWQVAISMDGRPFASRSFFDRPDVRETLHEASPAGWRIPIDTTGMAPGEHSLTVFVWTSEGGEGHYLQERKLTVLTAPGATTGAPPTAAAGDDLGENATQAAARIREHQQAEGYWLTAYTSGTRFHEPRPEMNTFLTALLVDLLDPLAASRGLEDNLQRARRHLTGQIEAGGLVRYHGRPDGPGIGTLGCAITPDTDDTALVWRIAPGPERGQLTAALATIDRYRTREGLYRSWLAPREAYRCLDPGTDPNPADVAIQMHLLLLLAEVRPPAGHALCEALRSNLDADRIWVYYRGTPLIPILRLADLHAAGCDLPLPEARMRTAVPGQEIWVAAARWLMPPALAKTSPPDAVLIRAVLRELAREDFALLRTDPPLLYHNDLTATVARYYWSEDVGYALWLRLYDQYEHHRDPHLGS